MNLQQVDRKCHVSGQIRHEDLNEIGAKGIKGIICNRPDGEAVDQPDFAELKAHAHRLGIPMHYIPYADGAITPKLLSKLNSAIDSIDGPVLLYCASGQRARTLWDAARGTRKQAA